MLGFEINVNDEDAIHVASDRSVIIFITWSPDDHPIYENKMVISGTSSEQVRMTWPKRRLKLGDKIKITCTEINEVSPIEKIRYTSKDEILEEYNDLKQELECKGII